jgi:hypothetical protein
MVRWMPMTFKGQDYSFLTGTNEGPMRTALMPSEVTLTMTQPPSLKDSASFF